MGKDISKINYTFHFCDGGSCQKAGSEQVVREARAFLKNAGASDRVHTIKSRCNGRCEDAPTWVVYPENLWYKNLTPAKGLEIIQSHLLREKPIEEYLLFKPGWEKVKSEKEKPKETAAFKQLTDPFLGEILLAKTGSSDQVLYPLFLFLFSHHDQIEVQLPGATPVPLHYSPVVDFTGPFDIRVNSPELDIQLAIAPIPADASLELTERKVGITEVIEVPVQKAVGAANYHDAESRGAFTRRGIRLRNRKGKELLTIWLTETEDKIWNQLLKNYLGINTTEMLIRESEQ